MKTESSVAVKETNAELTRWENRKGFLEDEIKRLMQTKETLQEEIDRKSADYNIYISQRDAESKKIRQDVLDEQATLAEQKAEFQAVLKTFQNEQALFAKEKETVQNQNARFEQQMNNIRQFIIAVQRASSLLGL